jgi:hypothetical protein
MSAYFLLLIAARPIKTDNPEASLGDIARLISQIRCLSPQGAQGLG